MWFCIHLACLFISSIYAPAINLSHGKKMEFIITTIEKAGNCVQQQFHN